MLSAEYIFDELSSLSNPEKAEFYPKFFKSGPGEYAEGDQFLGVTVPHQRRISKKYFAQIDLSEVEKLLHSEFHECRLTALLMLAQKYECSKNPEKQKEYVDFYLRNTRFVNNWDLVDSSAYKILGSFLYKKDCQILYDLAASKSLWEQRISIIATLYFIKKDDFTHTFALSEKLLQHPHDLMHKAVGWMLREVGNRNFEAEFDFLKLHYHYMPRTTLRYAIEKFPESLRQDFLKGRV